MKNCLILGSGRSGTSLVAGTLAGADYYMGENLHRPDESNPKGYFETNDIGFLQERILRTMMWPRWWRRLPEYMLGKETLTFPKYNQQLGSGHGWIAMVPVHREPHPQPEDIQQIKSYVSREPYCYKSPIFSYTLPAWRPYLKDTLLICVFREPQITARSIIKEVHAKDYLNGVDISYDQALELWSLLYRHILEKHRFQGDWLFLHYNQMFSDDGLDELARRSGASLNRDFPDRSLQRTTSQEPIPDSIAAIYAKLCQLANYTGNH